MHQAQQKIGPSYFDRALEWRKAKIRKKKKIKRAYLPWSITSM
jgi:hypothetical protein